MTSSAHPHEEPGLSPMEFIRLQEELQRSRAELAAANDALRESERELERRVEERTRELSTLLNVSHTITTTLELESLLGLILDQLKIVVDYTTASINSLEGNMLQAVATRSRLPFEQGRKIRYPVDEAIDRKVITTRTPIVIPDIHADTPLARSFWANALENSERIFGDQASAVLDRLYEEIHTWARIPLISRDQVIGMLTLNHERVDYYSPPQLDLAMAFAGQAAIAIENARLFATQQRRAEQFRVIGEVGRRITSILSLDQLLVETARTIRESFGYHHVHIGMVEGGEIVFKTMGAAPPGDDLFQNCEAVRLIAGRQGLVGWAAGTGEPVLVQDVDKDPRFVAAQDDRTRSEAAIPIKIKGAVIGVLEAESDRVNGFDDSDMIVLQSLADQVAVAIENARLYEQARDVAALEERQKLARELHDSVSQALYGIVLGARTARTQLDRDPAKAAEPLEYILSLSEAGLAEMRALIFELRPESLQTEGLVAALGRLVNALGARYQLEVRMEAGGEPDVALEVKESLYRIAQEAMNNIAKHARAGRVEIQLAQENRQLILGISDDGMGFDRTQSFPGHLGLHTMRERAEKAGGTFSVESAPNAGTRIQVRIPRPAR